MSIPTRPTYAGRRWLLLLSLLLGLAAHAVPERYSYDPGRSEIMRLVAAEAMAEGLAPDLALAVARVESDFVASAVSPAGAVGVMQIMPATAWGEFLVPREDLFNAEVNVNLGVRFLKQLIDRYGDVEIALSHYNGGSAVRRPSGALRVIPATRGYVDRVLAAQLEYRHHPTIIALRREQQGGPRYASLDPHLDDFDGSNPRVSHLSAHPARETAHATGDIDHSRSEIVRRLRAIRARLKQMDPHAAVDVRQPSLAKGWTEDASSTPRWESEAERRQRLVREWESYSRP